MKSKKIAYICWVTNPMVRSHLDLRDYRYRNVILKLFRQPQSYYIDYGIWNSDFIEEFEKMEDYEFHIISPHNGMLKDRVEFVEKGISYHIYKCDTNLLSEAYRSYSHQNDRTDYRRIRNIVHTIVKEISPDVVIVCGAEQPNFSPCIWDLKDIPTLVLLETAVNDPQLKEMLPGARIYSSVEKRSFEELSYFATALPKYYQIVRQFNQKAQCLRVSFPSHIPPALDAPEKKIDFLFYAAVISQNKGVEDVILAFNKVILKHPNATLNICGRCDVAYREHLKALINKEAEKGVSFTGFFDTIDEKLKYVQSTRVTVLPGITAPLNSTVRESMLMGLPTIVYETEVTPLINKQKPCLLCAEMLNVDDLSGKMLYALENPAQMIEMAQNAKEYAVKTFSNKAKAAQLIQAAIAVMNHFTKGERITEDLLYTPSK